MVAVYVSAEDSHHDSQAGAEGVLRASSNRACVAVRVSNYHVLAVNHSQEVVVRDADDVQPILETLFRSILLRNLFPPPARLSSAQCLTRRI